jgi:CDP-glycerol glycerophosphotransferase (TagB/SpsB family)
MTAATSEPEAQARQQTLRVVSRTALEVGCALLSLAALVAALRSATVPAALLTSGAALTAGVASWLQIRSADRRAPEPGRRPPSWLAGFQATRSILPVTAACALAVAHPPGQVVAVITMIVAIALVVLEPHLRRLHSARIPVVANLPGVDPVAPLPDTVAAIFWLGLLASVGGTWCAALGLTTWPWLVLVLVAAVPVALLAVAGRRRVADGARLEAQIRKGVADLDPQFIVYTARPDDASYQVSMWLPYLQRSGRRFLIVARDEVPARALAALTDVPVVQRLRLAELDTVITPATRAAFYVNASSGNGAFVRYSQLTHVYLGHGDSDKPPSYNPTHAMFDKIFAAGSAATRRYAAHGVRIAQSKFEVVGRPQVEGVRPADGPVRLVDRPVVLYAPTWRGHVEETRLSSLPLGDQIVSALLRRDVVVVFRPHPFSYDDEAERQAISRIHRLLARDAETTRRPHRWGAAAETELGILDCINASDAMVSDVSSVVSDYLFSGKPFAMVAVSAPLDAFAEDYPIARAAYVLDGSLANLDRTLDLMLGDDPMAGRRVAVKADYLGDFPSEGYADVFIGAVRRLADSPRPEGRGGIDATDEPEPARGLSLRRRLAALLRDAAINAAAGLAVGFAILGHLVPAAAAAVLSVATIAWFRRGVLPQPRRWESLQGSNLPARAVLSAGTAVAAAAGATAGAASRVAVATAALLIALVVLEAATRQALGLRVLRGHRLPGLQLTVTPLLPWGASAVASWVVLGAVWVLTAAGAPAVLMLGLAAALLLVVGEAFVRALVQLFRSVSGEGRLRAVVDAYRPEFAVYFASTVGAAYQVGMWLPYLERLGRPFLIVTRSAAMLRQLEPLTTAPVVHRPTLGSLEDVVVSSMSAAFYVNNAVRNTHFVERRQLTHVWLNHGDSEKPACYNPVHAIYDKIFAAGQAGIDRYARHGVDIPREKFEIVGRPQVEAITKARGPIAQLADKTVLYAPTWRGPFADSRVYSLPLGEQIVSALLSRGVTVIFRAHPFNARFPDAVAMMESLHRMLAADAARTGRRHLWGAAAEQDLSVEQCFNASDAMVADVSAVVSDYLQSDKPFSIVSMGRSPEQLLADAPAAEAAYVLREDLSNLDAVVDELLEADTLASVRRKTRVYYLGDFPPDRYADGFLTAARNVLDAGKP